MEQHGASWPTPRPMSRVCARTTGWRTRISRCDDESASSSASSRLDQPSAFCRCMLRSTTGSTFTATLSPAARFGPSGSRRCKPGSRRRPDEAQHQGLCDLVPVPLTEPFAGRILDQWAYLNGVEIDFSRPGKPTDNAFIEAFNARFRAECLNASWFLSMADVRDRIAEWRSHYNEDRP